MAALQQPAAELRFDHVHDLRHGRLRAVQLLRRLAEASRADGFENRLEFSLIHKNLPRFIRSSNSDIVSLLRFFCKYYFSSRSCKGKTLDKQAESTEQTTEEASAEQSSEQTSDAQVEEGQTGEAPEQQEQAQPETPQVTAVTVMATDVSVRDAPSTDGGFLSSVNVGETYTKLGTEGDWTKIDYMGTEAYIKSEFVQDVTN